MIMNMMIVTGQDGNVNVIVVDKDYNIKPVPMSAILETARGMKDAYTFKCKEDELTFNVLLSIAEKANE